MDIATVKQAALECFAERGYEGTSLATIAARLGIKKQSLSTYYPTKQDLLFAVFTDVYERRMADIEHDFARDLPTRDLLFAFLDGVRLRYADTPDERFWLRMALFEQVAREERYRTLIYRQLGLLEGFVRSLFPDDPHAGNAFLGVYDSLCVELVFGDAASAQRRLEDSWNVFWRGVTAKGGGDERA
ncbi:MAG: TetR/AcrR family transcriptional regulator [Eggerthellaceae bacterium]|jgi:AcrR family transcriptional regulator